jgi:hypothetical protein
MTPNPLEDPGRRKSHPGLKSKRQSRSLPGSTGEVMPPTEVASHMCSCTDDFYADHDKLLPEQYDIRNQGPF